MNLVVTGPTMSTATIHSHCTKAGITIGESTDAIFSTHPKPIETDAKVANASVSIFNYNISTELRESLYETIGIDSMAGIITHLYAFYNGNKFSDWMELASSGNFMNGDVGPYVGFTTGVGFKVKEKLEIAVSGIEKVYEFLNQIEFRGEILLGLTEGFAIGSIDLGHQHGPFALYSELCKGDTQGMMEFLFNEKSSLDLHESVVIGNLVTKSPFPIMVKFKEQDIRIKGVQFMEKHLWRLENSYWETVLITAYGNYINEARSRISRTLHKMKDFDPALQHRTDYGYHVRFLFNEEVYQDYKNKRFIPKEVKADGEVVGEVA